MWKFVVFGVFIVLYLISYHLEVKADNSKSRQVFVWIWVILMVGVFIYPLVVFDGWWKFLFLISLVVIFGSILIEGNKKSEIVNKDSRNPLWIMVSYWGHFFILEFIFEISIVLIFIIILCYVQNNSFKSWKFKKSCKSENSFVIF